MLIRVRAAVTLWMERMVLGLRTSGADRAALLGSATVAIVVVAWVEHAVDANVGLAVFYAIPVGILAWRASLRLALLVGALATLTWILADVSPRAAGDIGTALTVGATRLAVLGGVAAMVSSLRAERDELRAKLEEVASARYRQATLLASLRDPLLIVSRDGRVTECNLATRSFFGPLTNIVGRHIGDLVPFVGPVPADGVAHQWQGPVSDVGGRTVEVEVGATPMVAATVERWSLYVMHDVSQHEEVMRLREQLLYDVAHELRGPIGVLEGSLEVLDDELERDDD